MSDSILIIDFGSQVTQLIARRLREAGVYTEILPCTVLDPEKIKTAVRMALFCPADQILWRLLIRRVHQKWYLTLVVPVLGICYGQQTMCHNLADEVEPGTSREFGRALIDITAQSPLV